MTFKFCLLILNICRLTFNFCFFDFQALGLSTGGPKDLKLLNDTRQKHHVLDVIYELRVKIQNL